ncbi:MAG: CHAT domain-containing protein [Planctomycetota bacterium]
MERDRGEPRGRRAGHGARLRLALIAAALGLAPLAAAADERDRLADGMGAVYATLAAEQTPSEAQWVELLAALDRATGLLDVEDHALCADTALVLQWLMLAEGPWLEEVHALHRAEAVRVVFELADLSEEGGRAVWFHARRLMQQGRLAEAEQLGLLALDLWREADFPSVSIATLLGELYRRQERWSEAQEQLARADERLREIDSEQAWTIDARAGWFGARGQLELSFGRLDRAQLDFEAEARVAADYLRAQPGLTDEEVREVLDIPRTRALDLLLVAELYEDAVDEARQLLARAQPGLQPLLGAQLGAALAELEARAAANVATGAAGEAPESEAAKVLAGVADDPEAPTHLRLDAELSLARLLLYRDELEAASDLLASAGTRLAAWQSATVGHPPASERAFFEGLRVWRALLAEAPAEELAGRLDELEDALDAVLRSFRATPVLPDGVGFLHLAHRRSALGFFLLGCAELGQEERALAMLLRADALGSLARRAGVAAPSPAVLRAELAADGGGVWIVLPTLEHTHVLAVDEAGVEHALAPGLFELDATVRGFRRSLTRWRAPQPGDEERIEAFGERLAGELFPDAIARRVAEWEHVYAVGAQYLRDLELDALPFGDTRLGLAKALSHLPSITLGVHLARRWSNAEATEPDGPPSAPPIPPAPNELLLLVAANPAPEAARFGGELPSLPFDDADRGRLTAPFGERARALLGDGATREHLLGLDLSDVRLLHLVAHGVHDRARELPTGLALNPATDDDDGVLWASDLVGFDAPDVVVLSACGAARGRKRLGEDGATHLGGAFLERGAEAVLIASEDIELHATLRLSELLHAELARGAPLAEALRRARVQLADEIAHPFHATQLRVLGVGTRQVFREER